MSTLSNKKITNMGDHIVVDNSNKDIVPISCPVCLYLLRNMEDAISYREFKCCQECSDKWARPRKKDWVAGWRPSRGELQQEKIK